MANIKDMNIGDMYPSNLITNINAAKDAALANHRLSDMAKLKYIFDLSKEDIKKHNPQLYYAILGVVHSAKCMKCAGLFPTSDYFTHANESKEE